MLLLPPSMAFGDACARYRWTYPSARHDLSNISMDGFAGGKLYVPPAEYDTFLACVARALDRGERLYLVERRTSPLFRWHADLDLVAPLEVSEEQIATLAREIQRCALSVLGESSDNKLGLLVLRAASVTKPGGVKTGVHLVAPHLKVTSQQCAAIRDRALPALRRAVPLLNTWEDAYDLSVYGGSGLRMLGSRKMEPCKCPAATAPGCPRCAGTRRVDAGRAYSVTNALDTQGGVDERVLGALLRNTGLAMKYCSIRCYDSMQVRTDPLPAPVLSAPPQPGSDGGDGAAPSRRRASSDLTGMFEDLLVGTFGGSFAGLRIGEPRRAAGGVAVPVLHPLFCLNVNREHTSSHVYLWVTERGFVTQRCHCRKHGCDLFRSAPVSAGFPLLRACGIPLPFTFRLD